MSQDNGLEHEELLHRLSETWCQVIEADHEMLIHKFLFHSIVKPF